MTYVDYVKDYLDSAPLTQVEKYNLQGTLINFATVLDWTNENVNRLLSVQSIATYSDIDAESEFYDAIVRTAGAYTLRQLTYRQQVSRGNHTIEWCQDMMTKIANRTL